MRAVRVVAKLHWGFSVKHPFLSASQPSFIVPPYSTLIGALAYPWNLLRNGTEIVVEDGIFYSSVVGMLEIVPWVTFRLLDFDPRWLIETRDLNRVLMAPYVRSDHVYPYSNNLWGVQAHGKVYAPGLTLEIVYLVRSGLEDHVARAAWGLTRIGVKEALVSVQMVSLHATRLERDAGVVETLYSFPLRLGEVEDSTGYLRVPLPSLTRERFALGRVQPRVEVEDHVVPAGPVKVKPSPSARVVLVEGLGYILAPREVVG